MGAAAATERIQTPLQHGSQQEINLNHQLEMELLEVMDEQSSEASDPRFGLDHHPIIAQTKISKQPALVNGSNNDSSDSYINKGDSNKDNSAVEYKSASLKKAKQYYFSLEPVQSADMQTKSLLKRELNRRHLEIRRRQLHDKLSGNGLSKAERHKAQRLLWVLVGCLDFNLSLTGLKQIYRTYARLDLIPEGYHYAMLYQQDAQPQHMK